MSPIFNSGAFVQQCFSIHPLCLSVKKLAPPEHLLLSCSSCQLSHRLTLRSLATRLPGQNEPVEETGEAAVSRLSACADAHRAALGVSALDVMQDTAEFRCAECRRLFTMRVAVFETHQR
ncbi:hypothetical protein [Candidatus Nitrospira bockiana]